MKVHFAKEYDVRSRDLQLIMRPAVIGVGRVFEKYKKKFTITCTGGGDHSLTSLHYWGFAFDVRTRHLTLEEKRKIYNELTEKFKGTGYQIIMEKTHFHVEYDPPRWTDLFYVCKD